ncbi:hypothetical protein AJ80_00386 [Polytolypa hystricis UAMH7299]|uniref:Amidohydrolase-related domain-containing protein n=1 Tax=Polytolypa hystricis (strain UAMH7299) TaxID=1447883 RepID=A0A2B7Z1M6_POLH7|nr:hypothetical protein AJ80_00386 [Polytolypa hystricis UAMH7299]
MSIPIIDSHIHLFAASHLDTLAWHSPSNPLGSQHSVAEYRQAASSVHTSCSTNASTYLRGFIFLETDRISSLSPENWSHALDEVSFLTRIAKGEPLAGEGHEAADSALCLAIVPWAPVPAGPAALQSYLKLVRERTGDDVWPKIRGVRYLVQDKPWGTMLENGLIEGLRWLGQQRLVFDLGVDARQGGLWQLEQAAEMLERVYDGIEDDGKKLRVVINHLCKPNLRLPYSTPLIITNPIFLTWKRHITSLSRHPHTYMKLSGAFSELPTRYFPLPVPKSTTTQSSSSSEEEIISSTATHIQPWTDVVFDCFGPARVLFGSDWPVCNVGGGGNRVAWRRWREVVEVLLERRGLSVEGKGGVWGGVAGRVYGVDGV